MHNDTQPPRRSDPAGPLQDPLARMMAYAPPGHLNSEQYEIARNLFREHPHMRFGVAADGLLQLPAFAGMARDDLLIALARAAWRLATSG